MKNLNIRANHIQFTFSLILASQLTWLSQAVQADPLSSASPNWVPPAGYIPTTNDLMNQVSIPSQQIRSNTISFGKVQKYNTVVRIDSRDPEVVLQMGFTPNFSGKSGPGSIFQHVTKNSNSWVSTSILPDGVTITSAGIDPSASQDFVAQVKYFASKGQIISGYSQQDLFKLYPTQDSVPPPTTYLTRMYVAQNVQGAQAFINGQPTTAREIITNIVSPESISAHQDILLHINPVWDASAKNGMGAWMQPSARSASNALEYGSMTLLNSEQTLFNSALEAGGKVAGPSGLLAFGGSAASALGSAANLVFGTVLGGTVTGVLLNSSQTAGPLHDETAYHAMIANADAAYSTYVSGGGKSATYADFLTFFVCNGACQNRYVADQIDQIRADELLSRVGGLLSAPATAAKLMIFGGGEAYYGSPSDPAFVDSIASSIAQATDPIASQEASSLGFSGDLNSSAGLNFGYNLLDWGGAVLANSPQSPILNSPAANTPYQAYQTQMNISGQMFDATIRLQDASENISTGNLGLLQGQVDIAGQIVGAVSSLGTAAQDLQTAQANLQTEQATLSSTGFGPSLQSAVDYAGALNVAQTDLVTEANQLSGLQAVQASLPSQFVDPDAATLGASTESVTTTLSSAQTQAFLVAAKKSGLPLQKSVSASGTTYAFVTLPFTMGGFTVRVPLTQ